MLSKTSFFNKTVFKNNTTRFWPGWVLYLVILLFTFPISFLSNASWGYYDFDTPLSVASELMVIARQPGIIVLSFAFAIAFAVELYSYLYTTKSAGMIGSFPVTRREMFFTNYLTGVIWFVGANIITAVLYAIALMTEGKLVFIYVLQFFTILSLMEIFFFSLATFCASLTGSTIILPLLFAAVNFVFAGFELLIKVITEALIFGYSPSSNFATDFLTPVYKFGTTSVSVLDSAGKAADIALYDEEMLNQVSGIHIEYSGWGYLIGSVIVGLVLVAIAVYIIKYRHYETATDVVSVKCLRPVFKVVASLAFAMGLGYSIYVIFFQRIGTVRVIPLALSMGVCAIIGYFIADMLVQKSFRVFKNWLKPAICAVVVMAVVFGINADILGIESKVPDADKVGKISVSCTGESAVFTSEEDIKEFISIHKRIIDDKENIEENMDSGSGNWAYCDIRYFGKDGKEIIRRSYCVPLTKDGEVLSGYLFELEEMFNAEETIKNRYHIEDGWVNELYIEYYTEEYGWFGIGEDEIPAEQLRSLYKDAVLPDILDGKMGKVTLGYYDHTEYTGVTIEVNIGYGNTGENDGFYAEYFNIQVTKDAVRTIEAIRALGIDIDEITSDL